MPGILVEFSREARTLSVEERGNLEEIISGFYRIDRGGGLTEFYTGNPTSEELMYVGRVVRQFLDKV